MKPPRERAGAEHSSGAGPSAQPGPRDRQGRLRALRLRGFTLAEVAVTIVIVGIGLLLVLQGLNTGKLTAAHTRNYKLSRELALLTLGQVESGEYQEDISSGLHGSYADEGYPDFTFDVVVGDETFRQKNADGTFDSWEPRPKKNDPQDKDKQDEEKEQPFEKVKIRITFPKLREFGENANELILERWIPWKQVYGETEDDKKKAAASTPAADAAGAAPATGGTQPTSGGK